MKRNCILFSLILNICYCISFVGYCENRSVDDAVSLGLFYVFQHLDSPDTYARIHFVNYSSAFNTIIHSKQQVVKIGGNLSSPLTLSTGPRQGCILSPMLLYVFTFDCLSSHESITMLKLGDDARANEFEYRNQMSKLISWCNKRNYCEFRRNKSSSLSPILIDDKTVEIVQH